MEDIESYLLKLNTTKELFRPRQTYKLGYIYLHGKANQKRKKNKKKQNVYYVQTLTTTDIIKSVIYRIRSQDCHKHYIGELIKNIKTKFYEHMRVIETNEFSTEFFQHFVQYRHSHGTSEDTIKIFEEARINTLEKFHINNNFKNAFI